MVAGGGGGGAAVLVTAVGDCGGGGGSFLLNYTSLSYKWINCTVYHFFICV